MSFTFIVAAAGSGKRMGLGYPKQFLEQNGKPIFINCIEVMERSNYVDKIVVVTNEEYILDVWNYLKKYNITKIADVVKGGKERQDSIYNALKIVEKKGIIGVQDGARPFLKSEYIEESYKILDVNQDIDGVATGVRVKDTIKIVGANGEIINTPERKNIIAIHTPQIFRAEILHKAYDTAYIEGFYGTDDSSLVERMGKRVIFLEGGYDNIKITTKEDLKFLENI